MGNKVKYNLKNVYAAKMTETETEGVKSFSYTNPKAIPVLKCRVYSWDKDITDSIAAECFVWHRKSDNEESDADWDANHIGMKQINITTEDVLDNASFYCVVNMKEE